MDLCLLLVSIGRPVNRLVGKQRSAHEAETGLVYSVLARFRSVHADAGAMQPLEVFRDVLFEVNGRCHIAVPLNVPKRCPNYEELRREAQMLANLCYALEGEGIMARPVTFVPGLLARRRLRQRGSKFVECFGKTRRPVIGRIGRAVQALWLETDRIARPAFKVYRFKKGVWPETILYAVMRAARDAEPEFRRSGEDVPDRLGRAKPVELEATPPLLLPSTAVIPNLAAASRFMPVSLLAWRGPQSVLPKPTCWLQRLSATPCACGGGCPRCRGELHADSGAPLAEEGKALPKPPAAPD